MLFALCGALKFSFNLILFLGCLTIMQGFIQVYYLNSWSYPDGTIKEFLHEDVE